MILGWPGSAQVKFGMFIHWGMYSVPSREWNPKTDYSHEWFLEQTKMPVSECEKFRDQFNPLKFDAKQWLAIAKDAGGLTLIAAGPVLVRQCLPASHFSKLPALDRPLLPVILIIMPDVRR